MIDAAEPISIRRQCVLASVSRNRCYRKASEVSVEDLSIMERMDQLHTEDPSAGARRLAAYLQREGLGSLGRKRVRRLMRQMAMQAVYPRPRTTIANARAARHPYLLRNLKIERPNQVWCADITYIPMRRGFLYLVAILDWHSRKVLAWEVSNTLDTAFCLRALRRAIEITGVCPQIMNTDQGTQFTSDEWTGLLKNRGISISMDGKGAWRDNVIIERFWRSLKYEDVYLRSYADGQKLTDGLQRYIEHYNERRPHQSLGNATPQEIYSGQGWQPEARKIA